MKKIVTENKLNACIHEMRKYSSRYDVTEEKNQQAWEAVKAFFTCFKDVKPSKKYNIKRKNGNNYSYMSILIAVREMMIAKKYSGVCHELITMIAYEDILQARIYYNLIDLYEKYFKE